MRNRLSIFLFASLLLGYGMPLLAQERVIRDTLKASLIEDSRIRRAVGIQVVESDQIRNQVSAMGESDYIKFIQTLPGVSSGADGTSSIYVRGVSPNEENSFQATVRVNARTRTLPLPCETGLIISIVFAGL